MDKINFGKILIIISMLGLIFSISMSSFVLINLNDAYEKSVPIFDKIGIIKTHIDTFDGNLEEFSHYLKDVNTKEYMQRLSNMKSLINTLNSFGFGSLVTGINEDISRFEDVLKNLEKLKLNLDSARNDFSEIKSSFIEYDVIKTNIIGFVKIFRLYVLGMMIYSITLNGLLLYVGYYFFLKSKE